MKMRPALTIRPCAPIVAPNPVTGTGQQGNEGHKLDEDALNMRESLSMLGRREGYQ
jgi:hypothetical protein